MLHPHNQVLSARDYQAIVEQAPILIWRSDTSGSCDYFNDRWLDFTGRTMEQELGDGWADGVHPDDLAGCLATYRDAFAQRKKFQMKYRLRRHDLIFRWISDWGVPMTDADGQFTGYIGSCVDITDNIHLEELRRKTQETEIKTLRGLLPICAHCKKIRDDQGYWQQIESYVTQHSDADFTHGICPTCFETHYPELTRRAD
jgi:PAS domain S-box-containing protein